MKAPLPLLVFPALAAVLLPGSLTAQRADDDFQLGIGLVRRGLHDEATDAFQRFLERHPEDHARSAEAWYRLGSCHAERGRTGPAADALARALQLGGARFELRAEALYRLGTARHTLGEHADALRAFEPLLELTARGDASYLRPAAFYGAAECARATGRTREALTWFLQSSSTAARSEATEEKADGGYAFAGAYQAGLLCLESGDHDKACEIFGGLAQVFAERDDLGELWFLAGEAAFRGDRIDDARTAWRSASEAGGPTRRDARLGLAWCAVRAGDNDRATNLFSRVVEQHDGDDGWAGSRTARLELGRLQQQAGDSEAAVSTLGELLEKDGVGANARAEALEITGLALLDLDRAEEAERAFQAALSVDGAELPGARLELARADALAARAAWEDADRAYAAAEQAAREGGADLLRGDAIYGRCVALHRLGQHEDSLAQAERLRSEFHDHPAVAQAAFAIAENLFALERWQLAREAYDALPADHPDAAAARFKSAWASYLDGEALQAADRFAGLAADEQQPAERREEALSMLALACYDAERPEAALAAADLYRTRYRDGAFLSRTERVAGRVLRKNGDLRAASERLARAAAADGADASAVAGVRLEQADVLYKQGDFETAARLYADVAEASGDGAGGARALEGLAWCAFELGEDDACADAIERALRHPDADAVSPGVLELATTLHHRAEDHDAAAEHARRFLARHPDHPRAPDVGYALGLALSRGGQHAEALEVLGPLSEQGRCSRMDRVWYELGWCLRRTDDEEAALRAFANTIEHAHPNEPQIADEARLHVAEAKTATGDADAARTLLTEVSTPEHRPRALYRIGFGLLQAGEHDRAIEPLRELADGESELALDGRFLLGEACARAGRHDAALEALRPLIRRHPDHERAQDARLRLGRSAVEAGEHAEAIGVLDEWLQRDRVRNQNAGGEGDDPTARESAARAWLWIGRARAARDEHQRAEAAFAEAVERTDTEIAAEAQYRIGTSRKARGRLDSAAEAWVRLGVLYAQEPWVPDGLRAAAQAYDELGQPEKAARFRKELAERYPDADGR